MAVLAVEVTWPSNNEGELSQYEPWTVTSHWEQTIVEKVQGFGGAFLFLLSQPYGRWLLGIVALGFIALGLHSFACARWVRLLGSTG